MSTYYVVDLLSSEDEDDQDEVELISENCVGNKENEDSSKITRNTNEDTKEIIEIDLNSSQESANDDLDSKQVLNPYSGFYTPILFQKFYQRCFRLDRKDGMKRILERKLLPVYKNTKLDYLKSKRFSNFLTTLTIKIKREENLKFSIVKELLDALLSHQISRKRVQPITLSKETQISKKENKRSLKHTKSPGSIKRKKKTNSSQNIIILDKDDNNDDDIQLIDTELNSSNIILTSSIIGTGSLVRKLLHHNDNDEIPNNKQELLNNNQELPNNNQELPNNNQELPNNNQELPNSNQEVPNSLREESNVHSKWLNQDLEVSNNKSKNPNQLTEGLSSNNLNMEFETEYAEGERHSLLTEKNHIAVSLETQDEIKDKEIRYLEEQLKYCRMKIKFYDEQEVVDDSPNSPYVLAESLKTKSLIIYKKLCHLTGSSSAIWKPKRIRFNVKEGHPPGPARMLEQWLNLNVDGGYYTLPDLSDVIQCVELAVGRDGLGWSKGEVVREAHSLFLLCGTSIQKFRQRREWKDLITTAEESVDPAEQDPTLQAKLDMNKQIGTKNELELMEHYTNLELGATRRQKSNEIPQSSTNNDIMNKQPYVKLDKVNLEKVNKDVPSRKNNNKTVVSNVSETLVDSTTPEFNDIDGETQDLFIDEHRSNNTESINKRNTTDLDTSDGHIDSTTFIYKESDNIDVQIRNNIIIESNNDETDTIEGKIEFDSPISIIMDVKGEENIIRQEVPEQFDIKIENHEVIDGTADFVKQYGHITESDIIELRTIIFNNEPTVILDISDSDSDCAD